ncbi:unnamed protein product [Cylicocyclus nassatus]|uniref:Uncharacterized protein n=1 Tax=Cylicocyclus nassatus TaxID=53992 RepID=A0AA36GX11_CYLNA|nr:unnamed protein product [Cylicocyclus nassatus]
MFNFAELLPLTASRDLALNVLLVCSAQRCPFSDALKNHVNKVLGFKKPRIAVVSDCQMAKKVHVKYLEKPRLDSDSNLFVSVLKLKVTKKESYLHKLAFNIYGSLTNAVEAFDRDPLNEKRKGKVFIGCSYKKLRNHLVLTACRMSRNFTTELVRHGSKLRLE